MHVHVFSLLVMITMLAAQWTGVIILGRFRRGWDWWIMLFGSLFQTLGFVPFGILYFRQTSGLAPDFYQWPFFANVAIISSLGQILFLVGFAIHASKLLRIKSRTEELELMNLAQATELERLRNR